jgi:hypothetical protein
VVSANMLVDIHNCTWLLQYPHESIAAGSMYAVRLPAQIPKAGRPGGPPTEVRVFFGFSREPRIMFQEIMRNPEEMRRVTEEMSAAFQKQMEERRRKKK